ncbi:MAG: hypothetical protein JWP52_4139, partial [Rhizobacter sp.]|nr:hypothetical protein [Rhizobacter sp.]
MIVEGSDRPSWWHAVWHKIRHSLPALIMLVSISAIVHPLGIDFGLATQMTRDIAASFFEERAKGAEPDAPGSGGEADAMVPHPDPVIAILQIPSVNVPYFEVSQPMSPELRARLGGNQPIDRVKVAQLLLTAAGGTQGKPQKDAKPEGDGKPMGDFKAKATVLA